MDGIEWDVRRIRKFTYTFLSVVTHPLPARPGECCPPKTILYCSSLFSFKVGCILHSQYTYFDEYFYKCNSSSNCVFCAWIMIQPIDWDASQRYCSLTWIFNFEQIRICKISYSDFLLQSLRRNKDGKYKKVDWKNYMNIYKVLWEYKKLMI